MTHSSLQPTHRMQMKTYYSDQFFLSNDVRSMSYCPVYWKVISLPTSKVFNFSLWRRSLQVGNVFSSDNYHFNSSAEFSSLLIGVPFGCPCSCHVYAHQLGTQDLRFPSQQGWPARPEGKCVLPFWGMQSVII